MISRYEVASSYHSIFPLKFKGNWNSFPRADRALRHLRRRTLLDPNVIATTSNPTRTLIDPRAR
jgi:hypothetical protein